MIRDYIHKELAAGRWFELTLFEQLGNIGSEYHRASRAHQKGDADRYRNACDRTLELLELSIDDERWRGKPALRELCRLNEEVARTLVDEERPDPGLQNYFDGHAYAARLAKLKDRQSGNR